MIELAGVAQAISACCIADFLIGRAAPPTGLRTRTSARRQIPWFNHAATKNRPRPLSPPLPRFLRLVLLSPRCIDVSLVARHRRISLTHPILFGFVLPCLRACVANTLRPSEAPALLNAGLYHPFNPALHHPRVLWPLIPHSAAVHF